MRISSSETKLYARSLLETLGNFLYLLSSKQASKQQQVTLSSKSASKYANAGTHNCKQGSQQKKERKIKRKKEAALAEQQKAIRNEQQQASATAVAAAAAAAETAVYKHVASKLVKQQHATEV